jgi:zinc D-Ala-D-Ala carboxypeptidase
MNLTKNFTLAEMTFSQTATRNNIRNIPDDQDIKNLKLLCQKILQPLRDNLGKPIKVTSGYRSPILNKAIGGSTNSQHTLGQAADIIVPGLTARQICRKIIDLKLPYDQLILEFDSWCHVSYGNRHRRQILTINKNGVRTGI